MRYRFFRAGFSTASVVTAVSGRGVGMDVVKTNIEKIGGTIDLKSVPGAGTTFTIKIPLTLAIVSALIVEAGGERFAIPQISVVELVRASYQGRGESGSVIEHIDGTPVLRLRDRLLPLVNLQDLLQLSSKAAGEAGAAAADTHCIVVTQVGATTLGIIVDRIFDTEEIVVKPVAPVLRGISMFSGNTILGDGSVIMILDTNGIARATGTAGGEMRATAKTEGRAEKVRRSASSASASSPRAAELRRRRRVAEGSSPKLLRYSPEKRPSCVKPLCSATSVTLACGPALISSWRARARRMRRTQPSGVVPRKVRKCV